MGGRCSCELERFFMKIMYYQGKFPNFGDALNTWMWPKILPHFFDEDEKVVFIGIGSTIGNYYEKTAKKIVFGAACVPGYNDRPDVHGGDWEIYFVRGYRTTQILHISPDFALGDAAILLRTVVETQRTSSEVVSFMPHWESLERGNWEHACRQAGINLIDPRRPIDEILRELLRSRMVLAEAMHGAIVADALRIPWVPLLPLDALHRAKWFEWALALGIDLKPHRFLPSSLFEAKTTLKHRPTLVKLIDSASCSPTSHLINKGAIYGAAHRLTQLARVSPCLSDERVIDRVTERMLEKVQLLRRNYAA
jgi:succinoglycan biosynthesis protein ExoV